MYSKVEVNTFTKIGNEYFNIHSIERVFPVQLEENNFEVRFIIKQDCFRLKRGRSIRTIGDCLSIIHDLIHGYNDFDPHCSSNCKDISYEITNPSVLMKVK